MRVMVIEHFKDAAGVYRRFDERGRMMPEGVQFVDSWVDASLKRCFQLMDCESIEQLEEWAANWADLVDFEFVPVVGSAEARKAILA
ncbi:MAG TPA: DUF3303 family protein [Longimicrobiales bacterium]|nr:DUF3303 family protein [Longimicrobiales bacterium]